MKFYKNAIILIAVLALITVAYFVFSAIKGNTPGDDGTDFVRIFSAKTDDISRLTIRNKNGIFEFKRLKSDEELSTAESPKWEVVSPTDLNVDLSVIDSIVSGLSTIVVDKTIGEIPDKDIAVYGFDKPDTIKYDLKDGSSRSFEMGRKTDTGYAYYFREVGSSTVYTIDSYTAEDILISRLLLKDKQLFTFVADDIIGLSMDRNGTSFFTLVKDDKYWKITSPVENNANLGTIQPMFDAIVQSRALEYVEEGATDLAKYGLDKPAYAFEVQIPTKKIRLELGKHETKDAVIYAKLGDSNDIFTLRLDAYTFLDKPLKEVIEVFAYIPYIGDVSKVVVEMDGYVATCDIEADPDNKGNDKFYFNGRDATAKNEDDKQPFRNYYQALIGITLSDIELGANPVGDAEITITYDLKKEPFKVKVEFIPKDEDYYYVMRDGKYTGMVVAKKKFDEPEGIRDSYKKLVDFLNSNPKSK